MPRRRVLSNDLRRRGAIWWLRKRVPIDVVPEFGREWVEESLKTRDLQLARKRRDVRLSELANTWERMRRHGDVDTLAGLAEAHEWEQRFGNDDVPKAFEVVWDELDRQAAQWGRETGRLSASSDTLPPLGKPY